MKTIHTTSTVQYFATQEELHDTIDLVRKDFPEGRIEFHGRDFNEITKLHTSTFVIHINNQIR